MNHMNYWVTAVGILQFGAAIHAIALHDWKMCIINVGVGIANLVLSTMGK